jgi:Peptidase family C25
MVGVHSSSMKRYLIALSISILAFLTPHLNAQIPSKSNSKLATGEWHKISVNKEGIHKIDYDLVQEIGFSDTEAANLAVYGNKGGMLPLRVGDERVDDISELATLAQGLEDGVFDQEDYILFYAQGPSTRTINEENGIIRKPQNIYDEKNHYFVTAGSRKPITSRPDISNGDVTINTFDDYVRLEEDRVNLLGKFRPPGSGRMWFGDEFSAVREKFYNITFPNIVGGSELKFRMQFAGRSGTTSTVFASVEGSEFSRQISSVSLGNVEAAYSRIVLLSESYLAARDNQEVRISYPAAGSEATDGWLDYIEMQATRDLTLVGGHLIFRSFESANYNSAKFELNGVDQNVRVWDITDPINPIAQEFTLNGQSLQFSVITEGTVRKFVSFDIATGHNRPEYVGPVPNQDLHSLQSSDLVIIYHTDFEDAATQLAQHRVDYSNYDVSLISIQQIYNEFSGGSVDPTAIRDFAAMLKSRDENFQFLLLVGDGTYDYKHLIKAHDDDNYIPVYETAESMRPIYAFPSDDYYALLDAHEGSTLLGAIDIAVGRLPVGSADEANTVVEKIIHYDVGPTALGDWRQKLTYVADDEDSNLHLNQSEQISNSVEANNPYFNVDRIYLDAFPQVSTPGGPRYPEVNAAINSSLFKGVLAINYLGHGGPQGWAQERILGSTDIQSWTNFDRLPLVVTATCSFTTYDEPSFISAGEQVLLNPNGGAVALLSTVRAVYSSSNKRLTQEVFNHLFDQKDGEFLALGEIMRISKNSNSQDTIDVNARKFTIIGDPSMRLAYPRYKITLTELNGEPVDSEADTLGALDQVQIKGVIQDKDDNNLGQFNGKVTVTVYDKPVIIRTLANDPKSYEKEFDNLSRIIFKGTASVVNGEFELGFVIPKDINFKYGAGKISMYASDEISLDAAGSYEQLIIGGSSSKGNTDNTGPVVNLFINNESFQSGDVVGPNSTLLIKLFDENGINVIGNSIGHDLIAVLDDDPRQSFILNEFYEALENDFTQGEVRFPLSNIPPGRHSIKVTVWDVANNFTDASTEFIVETNPDNVIKSIISYPNPGEVGSATKFRIEHDLQTSNADVYIDIFDISGRLVSVIFAKDVPTGNGVIDDIEWNAENSSNVPSAAGILFYRARIITGTATSSQKMYDSPFNKLILLN